MTGEQRAPIADGSYEEYLALYSAINRQTLATASDHWEAVAGALTDVAGGLGASRDGLLANGGWSSDAANTFGAYMDTLVQQTQGLSTAATALSGGLRHATNTADQLAHNFPPQPPPPSDDPTVRNWTFPDGTTMQGTATDVRNHLTTQARKAVIGVYEDYSHAADRMAQAQAAAPVPSGQRAEPMTPISGSSIPTYGRGAVPSGRSVATNSSEAFSGSATAQGSPGTKRPAGASGRTGYEPQPEVSPLMIAQSGPTAGNGGVPPTRQSAGNPASRVYTPGSPDSSSGFPGSGSFPLGSPEPSGREGPASRSSTRIGPTADVYEPGISGGQPGPGTVRRPAMFNSADDLGDGVAGAVPLNDGSRPNGRGFTGSISERGATSGTDGGIGEDTPGMPRSGSSVAAGNRLNGTQPDEAGVRQPRLRSASIAEPEPGEGMPMYPGSGMGAGAGAEERQRGKRPKYLVQDPSYWMSKQDVVPPVIE